MGTEYRELGPLGRNLATIWEIHLRSTGKSTHTIRSYVQGVRALAGFLTDQGLPLDPEEISTRRLRAFQAHLLLPTDEGGAGKRTSTVCTRHDALKLFFSFLEEEDDLPNPMRRCSGPPRTRSRSSRSPSDRPRRLIARGELPRRSRTYRAPDDHRAIALSVDDQVILRRNQRLTQPDGSDVAVRNGMTGRVVATRRRSLTVELEATHRTPVGAATITLPTAHVGEHVDYGYARTVDTAQGTTVDHSLFAPSTGSSAERAYVALSRGRLTNRIYATHDRTWIDAIGHGRSHTLAVDQAPELGRTPHRTAAIRHITHNHERHAPLELDL